MSNNQDGSEPSSSGETDNNSTNWKPYCLCQKSRKEKLVTPFKVTRTDQNGSGYQKLSQNLRKFNRLGTKTEELDRLDDGHGLEETLKANEAVYHRSCYLKYNDNKVKRAVKRKSQELAQSLSPVKTQAARGGVCKDADKEDEEICFFCDKAGGVMHQARTDSEGIDQTVEDYAKAINDAKILAKLAMGDMHSQGAVYHKDCLSALHNKARKYKTEHSKTEKRTYSESIALSELVTYIEKKRLDEGADLYFKLADLAKLYHNRLEQLGVPIPKRIKTTRLKERLLDQMHGWKNGKMIGQDQYELFVTERLER